MRHLRMLLLPASILLIAATCCKEPVPADPVDNYKGLVLNEISAHDEIVDAVSWVEILNTSEEEISLKDLGLYITDE